MKTRTFPLVIILGILTLSSCKSDIKDTGEDQIVLSDTVPTATVPEFMYVTAVSGLTLRNQPNLQSEKLQVMPLGTKIKLAHHDEKMTMNVGGIDGSMDEVEYNGQKGYVFNGFISKFPPSGENAVAKNYFEDLQDTFPDVNFTEITGGTASKPTKTQTIILPTGKWHEAFFMAQQVYGIPRQFAFPQPTGSNSETLYDSNKKKDVLISDLHISRASNSLQKITYSYAKRNLSYTVIITKEGDRMKLEKVEEIK